MLRLRTQPVCLITAAGVQGFRTLCEHWRLRLYMQTSYISVQHRAPDDISCSDAKFKLSALHQHVMPQNICEACTLAPVCRTKGGTAQARAPCRRRLDCHLAASSASTLPAASASSAVDRSQQRHHLGTLQGTSTSQCLARLCLSGVLALRALSTLHRRASLVQSMPQSLCAFKSNRLAKCSPPYPGQVRALGAQPVEVRCYCFYVFAR